MAAATLAIALASLALLAPGGSAAPPSSRLFSSVNVLFTSPLHPYDAARMSRGGIRVEHYGKLVRVTADAIRQVDPGARIALAGVPGRVNHHGISYLKNLYERVPHIRSFFDVVAFHPYAQGVHGVVNQLRRVRRTMREHGDGGTPLWVSEIGWGSRKRDPSQYNFGRHGQAGMLTAALLRARAPAPPAPSEQRHLVRLAGFAEERQRALPVVRPRRPDRQAEPPQAGVGRLPAVRHRNRLKLQGASASTAFAALRAVEPDDAAARMGGRAA